MSTTARSAPAAGSDASCSRATSSRSQQIFEIVIGALGCSESVWYAPSSMCGFSLLQRPLHRHSASPAYSIVSTAIVIVTRTRSVLSSRLPTCGTAECGREAASFVESDSKR